MKKPVVRYRCRECKKLFRKANDAIEHVEDCHAPSVIEVTGFLCDCGKFFMTRKAAERCCA